MNIQAHDRIGRASAQRGDMSLVPGSTFRMGSDKHYPEEASAHRVTVDSFWIDRTPVTNAAFRGFAEATGYVTFAEIGSGCEGLSRRIAAYREGAAKGPE